MTQITLKEVIVDSEGWFDLKHLFSINIVRSDIPENPLECLHGDSRTVHSPKCIVLNGDIIIGRGLSSEELYSLYSKASKAAVRSKLMEKGTYILYTLQTKDDSDYADSDTDNDSDDSDVGYNHKRWHIMKITGDTLYKIRENIDFP